jgi:hypothetical protein
MAHWGEKIAEMAISAHDKFEKRRNPFGAAAAATLLYRKKNIYLGMWCRLARRLFFQHLFFFIFFLVRLKKFRVDGTTFFFSVQVSVRTRAIFSQWSLYNRMKRIGGSRSYRRLSIEALKKKRGGPSVVCMQRRMGRSSTKKKDIYLSSLFSPRPGEEADRLSFQLLYRVQTHIHNEKKNCKLDGTVHAAARIMYTHTHTWTGFSFLTFQLLTSSKENEPGRVPSDKAKEVLLLLLL